jgi:hypothetical protein
MPEQAARNLSETEGRIQIQLARIEQLEAAGRVDEARRACETLAVITETRDALRLRLRVARDVAATEIRFQGARW